jgi:hypothetical protein
MKATILDLRYRMREILRALNKRERVTIFYHGKVKGTIIPVGAEKAGKVEDHPFFKMDGDETKSVDEQMDELRGSRFDDI